MTNDAKPTNAEQIAYWNDVAGAKWVKNQDRLDEMIRPLGEAAIEHAQVREGERVLDVGCGCGETTLALAKRVGLSGSVVGVDISAPMLGRAKERARDLPAVSFVQADAQTHAFEPRERDLVFSRFGVMFFEDAAAAFANLAKALRPGGRVTFVCWQAAKKNDWVRVPMASASKLLTFTPPADPTAPGPFSLSDPARVESVLGNAGLGRIRVDPHEVKLPLAGGTDLDAVADFLLEIGPTARALQEQGMHLRPAVRDAVREGIAPFATSKGVEMTYAVWLVSAVAA